MTIEALAQLVIDACEQQGAEHMVTGALVRTPRDFSAAASGLGFSPALVTSRIFCFGSADSNQRALLTSSRTPQSGEPLGRSGGGFAEWDYAVDRFSS
jgi:hypothetical protein